MARVTVEDCVKHIPNKFELVILAANRAKKISTGASLTINDDNDKYPVIALREIACGNINADTLRESQIVDLQKNNKLDEIIGSTFEKNIKSETNNDNNPAPDEEDVFKSGLNFSFDDDLDFGNNFSEEEGK